MTASVKAIEAVRHECTKGWDETPTAGRHPYTELMVEFEVKDPGPAHVCGIHYTTDMWKTREVAYAECVLLDGPNGPGGVEKWAAHVNLEFQADLLEFAVFCYDYRDGDHVREIFDNNHGELYRATPLERAEARRPSEPKYARASAPEIRPSTLTGHGAAIRVMPEPRVQPKPPAAAATGRAIPAATLVSLDAVAPYLEILMMRNFATNTWKFTVNGKVSLPGCIIASPSEPGDAETDQSYANSWVRDSALCALEAGRIDLPWSKIDLLDDFVSFSRLTQQQARNANRQGHACFFVDGTLRPWGIQADGPALRTIAVLDFFDQLSGSGRDEAKRLINDDVSYLL
ncbi:MAG: hypothetical protein JXA67_00720, partial [Micromonosporaceae bacterium]|nr:hypothetical protein [Micromonosporaceae bacterium]